MYALVRNCVMLVLLWILGAAQILSGPSVAPHTRAEIVEAMGSSHLVYASLEFTRRYKR